LECRGRRCPVPLPRQAEGNRVNRGSALLISCRPRQWIKNGLVLVPLISSASFRSAESIRRSLIATAAFSFMTGAVYLLNDLADRAADRAHPTKKLRPIAAGLLSPALAAVTSLALAAVALALAAALDVKVLLVLALYALCNVGYSLGWRKEPVLD